MNNKYRKLLVSIFLLVLPMFGQAQNRDQHTATVITIQNNSSPEALLKQAPSAVKVVTRPPGVNFYSIDWSTSSLGKVIIEQGKKSIEVPHVRSLQGADDRWFPEENITEWEIYADISALPQISHDEARKTIYTFLQNIAAKGWEPLIDLDDPRMTGKDRFDYVIHQSPSSGLNIDYEPSLQEWMKLEDMSHWSFHGDDAFLTVTMRRAQEKMNVNQPGAYLLVITLTGDKEGFRAYVKPKERKNWRTVLPAALKQLQQQRADREAEAVSRGIKINKQYRDPQPPTP
ncbi:hypothetical protein [uncultured Herbaspirillum sp.]|uniref:hypothetical protein n=1 Tax=uncultured Herbaspirillum sp. TaxID=160236 RepID=UPI00258C7389|nr:hypothetical protein [uncultured Herbaspirillum sp.]